MDFVVDGAIFEAMDNSEHFWIFNGTVFAIEGCSQIVTLPQLPWTLGLCASFPVVCAHKQTVQLVH